MNVQLKGKDLIKIANSDDIFGIMQRILLRENKLDREKEHFWLVGLNNANKILFIELVSVGGVRSTVVEPMNVFRMSLIKGAVNVILAHNHPSGDLTPSKNDFDLTDRLIQVGKIIDVKVIDHLIITEKKYLSFSDNGTMTELENSINWLPSYVLENRIRKEEAKLRKEAVKLAKEKGKLEEKLEMAKQMKANNESIEKIMLYTGLTKTEIERLDF